MLSFLKTIFLFTSLSISTWQTTLYNEVVNRVSGPTYPQTILQVIDNNSINFISYAAYYDPANKYNFVMHDISTVPTWLFVMRQGNERKDELWHRGLHDGVPCNVLQDNKFLLHLKTISTIKTDIIFRVAYNVEDTTYGPITLVDHDKSFHSPKVSEFKVIVWSFPHPTIKNLVIIVIQGYISSSYPISFITNNIKWHVDNMLENFGERLISVAK